MFCGLEQIELTVITCPVKCVYKTSIGACAHSELSDDNVTPTVIAVVKNEKVYKVKAAINQGQRRIKLGLAIDRYADFVKSSFRAQERMRVKSLVGRDRGEVVNEKDSHVRKVLRRVFSLADNQQKEFWSEERFSSWAKRTGSAFTLADIKETLADIKL